MIIDLIIDLIIGLILNKKVSVHFKETYFSIKCDFYILACYSVHYIEYTEFIILNDEAL